MKEELQQLIVLLDKLFENCEIDYQELTQQTIDENFAEITLYVHPYDVGRVIGKDGRMISSIKTIISGCKPKGGANYKVNVKPIEE
jgi:predicted RNA-binding protein YlqC (UPF0109 family)